MEEKELIILTCYHCGNTGLMRVEGEYKTKRGGPIHDEGNNIVDYDPIERVEMRLLSCPMCLIGLRRVLEAICKDKGAEGTDLSKMVNDLVNKKSFAGNAE